MSELRGRNAIKSNWKEQWKQIVNINQNLIKRICANFYLGKTPTNREIEILLKFCDFVTKMRTWQETGVMVSLFYENSGYYTEIMSACIAFDFCMLAEHRRRGRFSYY